MHFRSYPVFMTSAKGQALQKTVWDETMEVLVGVAPEVSSVLEQLQRLEGAPTGASQGEPPALVHAEAEPKRELSK